MLQALQKLDRSRAASVLSLAAREFLPRLRDDHPRNQTDLDAAAELIKELSAKAQRRPPAEANPVAVQEALSREISSYLLSGVDSAEVRARVGDKGGLSPSLYKVTFSPKFQNGAATWGLSDNYVLKAIANCDQVQHFVSRIEAPNAPAHASLFTQIPPVKHDRYTILVKCQRRGDMLIVDEAYRVYPEDIDLVGATSPLDILRRFVEKVGNEVELTILNADETNVQPSERTKFFHNKIYNVPSGGFIIIKFSNGEIMRTGPALEDTPTAIDLCFEVNFQKYANQLARHGVKVEIPKRNLRSYTLRNVPAR